MKYVILWVLIIDVGALTGVVLSLCQILICEKVINKVIETYNARYNTKTLITIINKLNDLSILGGVITGVKAILTYNYFDSRCHVL